MINGQIKRDNYIDLLRGIAILLMILGHIIDYGRLTNSYPNVQMPIFDFVYYFIYSFHIPLFFVVSGYVQYINGYGKEKILYTIESDILALYLPYLLFVTSYWLERFFAVKLFKATLIDPLETNLGDLVALLFNGKSESWFLLSLLLVKIAFTLTDRIGGIWFSLLFFGFISYLDIFIENRFIHFLSFGLFFLLGYLLCFLITCKEVKVSNIWIRIIILGLWILIGIVAAIIKSQDTYYNIIIASVLSILLIILRKPVNDNLICYIGRNTMIVYFVHGLINSLVIAVLTIFLNVDYTIYMSFLCFICQVLICIFVIYISTTDRFCWMYYLFYPAKLIRKKHR